MQRIVIVIPTYNEAGNVVALTRALEKISSRVKSSEIHLLFVDDNSPDGTRKVIEKLCQTKRFIHLLNNKRKGGLGHAYKKGFLYAIAKLQADYLFQFDADLQHDENIIPPMIQALDDGADLVLGSRYMPGGAIPKNWPPHRKFLSIVGNLFIRFVMGNFRVKDWTTGYRGIKASVVSNILPLMGNSAFNGYTYQIGFLVKSLQKGYTVAEVPFHFRDRTSGVSKLGPEYIFNTMRYIMKARIAEIISSRIFKFLVVGGTGTLVQFTALYLYRPIFVYQLAFFLSIETAILSNFTFSNLWTFADRKLKLAQIPTKFVQFNLASGGSIVIQQAIAFLGEHFIGLFALFVVPIINLPVDTGVMYAVLGILIGMFWNFFAYSRFVWRKK